MKLIIECTEQTYSECKKISGLSETAFVIANGKPYDDSGDLISREALKTELNSRPFPQDYSTTLLLGVFNELIDNAPTVPTFTLEDMQNNWDDGAAHEAAKHDREKGEWIIVKDEKYGDNVKCPFCGKELAGTDLNFCCKCGADMRGDKDV